MSDLGQKRTLEVVRQTSALPPKADMPQRSDLMIWLVDARCGCDQLSGDWSKRPMITA
jgi:hypothetical protein